MTELSSIHPVLWVGLAIILLIQSSWIFYDASRRGENKWLWGLFGLLNTPGNLIIYLIVTRLMLKTKICEQCGNRMRVNAKYCPHCGVEVVNK